MKVRLPEPRSRLFFCGKTGTGKSTRLKELLRTWGAKGVRIVALDINDEYSQQGRETGLVRLGPLRRRVTAAQLAADPSLLLEPRLSLAVVPGGGARQWARALLMLAKMLRATKGGRVLFVVDEAGSIIDPGLDPACHQARAELTSLATNGRHAGIALALVTQRAAQLPPGIRSQATSWTVFRQDEPADLEALEERLGKHFSERVRALPIGEHLDWRDDDEEATTTRPALRAVT